MNLIIEGFPNLNSFFISNCQTFVIITNGNLDVLEIENIGNVLWTLSCNFSLNKKVA